ncbi:hypothetical protein LZ32DRAFT_609640 [Colletotrichum eremochloae]|nr:hypothetical protein LZ32DRAFT_609640 [Colletotrichum eremochloae]
MAWDALRPQAQLLICSRFSKPAEGQIVNGPRARGRLWKEIQSCAGAEMRGVDEIVLSFDLCAPLCLLTRRTTNDDDEAHPKPSERTMTTRRRVLFNLGARNLLVRFIANYPYTTIGFFQRERCGPRVRLRFVARGCEYRQRGKALNRLARQGR